MLSTELRNRLREGRAELRRRGTYTEEDTRSVLISPFLDAIGYDALHRKSEPEDKGNTPDEVAFAKPPGRSQQRHARVILEAKPLGTDFDSGPSRSETPERQLKRYLQNHIAAGLNTFGILTDGERYRVFQRTGHATDTRYIGEYNILEDAADDEVDVIERLKGLLGRDALASLHETKPESIKAARELVSVIADRGVSSDWLLNKLVLSSGTCQIISCESLNGRARHACQTDWGRADWRYGPEVETTQTELEGTRLVTAVVEFKLPEGGLSKEITRRDVALAATVFARQTNCRTAVVIARQSNSAGVIDKARVAVHHLGRTAMTYEFDPFNPPISVLKNLERIIKILNGPKHVSHQRLFEAVTAKTIRREFYQSIAQWMQSKQRGRRKPYRQSILRHLIRTVFAWILKEDGILPTEPFDDSFARRHESLNYHKDILMFMFHERLNVPEIDREEHSIATVDRVLLNVPFLNGSLFAVHEGDSELALSFEDYYSVDPDRPGLFTIMSRYDWTTDEHTPGESEGTLSKMPRGTYYTPSDVVMEMVKDALSTAVRFNLPRISLTEPELHQLFDDVEHDRVALNSTDARRMIQTLLGLSIFDPSVGSGAFLLTMTYAIRNAVMKLDAFAENPTRHIIQNQLHALDINPMAVQITRLRLFIAIITAEKRTESSNPLPNLEGRIVCADTLSTFAIPTWHAQITTDLAGTSPDLLDALKDRAGVLQAWRNAHTESEKTTVKAQDDAVRSRILAELKASGNQDHPELNSFARHQLLSTDAEPVSTDARLLFYQPDWTGFDIVIGNPPYEAIAKDKTPTESQAIKARLRDSLQYQTTTGGDLYNLFCEIALSVVKSLHGVVTLIVPLSIAASTEQAETRRLFERRCGRIWLRNHDIRPGKIFHDSPVKNPENRQRATIVTAVTGNPKPSIDTTATSKWLASERELFLRERRYTRLPDIPTNLRLELAEQWPRVPTNAIRRLLIRMMSQKHNVRDFARRGETRFLIGLPNTAFYFVSVSPAGLMDRVEKVLSIDTNELLEIIMAALNGHVAFMWWLVWSDALNITKYQFESMPIPDKWIDNKAFRNEARLLGHSMIDAIKPENIELNTTGTAGRVVQNINFHDICPDLIEQADELYLDGLGLMDDALLAQLREFRSSSNWRLNGD